MKRTRKALRWLGRRAGILALGFAIMAYWGSAYRAISIQPTRHEHVGFICGMCQVAWRTKLDADPNVFGSPGIYTNEVGSHAWMSQFSGGPLKDHYFVWFPMWVFIIGGGGWAAAGVLWPRAVPPGQCRKCGYDQAGLAESLLCPECGRARTSSGAAP